eukprot:TRINITY_DN10614_c0_g2_i2.p1 TRINITY_DN10614_c0_g2~~TRINITY_DN10614_c0_g2_i2.p1  ORF type:complete len:402 (+),score=75.88 TRINITY_DN10614_c0_g2_i2:121-1206(+)
MAHVAATSSGCGLRRLARSGRTGGVRRSVAARTGLDLGAWRCFAADAAAPRRWSKPLPPPSDLILGIAIRKHVTGYALLRCEDLLPLQFGLVDVRKAEDVQQKALEISVALKALRATALEKLQQASPSSSSAGASAKAARRWLVSLDDSVVDRSVPRNAAETSTQRAVTLLQGLVTADAKRLFKVAPALIHPRLSRKLLGVQARGLEGRRAIYELANQQVSDFPEVRTRGGQLAEDTYLMSDAWACARYAQRAARIAQKRQDPELMAELRREVFRSKRFKRLREAAAELQPRRAGRELEQAMESRITRAVDSLLHRMLEEEIEEARAEQARRAEEPNWDDEEEESDDDFASTCTRAVTYSH